MRHRHVIILALACAAPGLAFAGDHWSANVNWASNYESRGFNMSIDPATGDSESALQGGVDYNNNGWFVGTFVSTVNDKYILGSDIEWDTWAGYAGETEGGLRYTASVNYYKYPGSDYGDVHHTDYSYGEVIVGAGMGPVDVSYAVTYTKDYFGYNTASLEPANYMLTGHNQHTRGSGYLSVDTNFPVGDNFTLGIHAGHEFVRHMNQWSFSDAKVSLSTRIKQIDIALAYARAWNSHGNYGNDIDGEAILTVGHTF